MHAHLHVGKASSVNTIHSALETFGFNLINMFVNNVSISILSDGWLLVFWVRMRRVRFGRVLQGRAGGRERESHLCHKRFRYEIISLCILIYWSRIYHKVFMNFWIWEINNIMNKQFWSIEGHNNIGSNSNSNVNRTEQKVYKPNWTKNSFDEYV